MQYEADALGQVIQLANGIFSLMSMRVHLTKHTAHRLFEDALYSQIIAKVYPNLKLKLARSTSSKASMEERIRGVLRIIEGDILGKSVAGVTAKGVVNGDVGVTLELVRLVDRIVKRRLEDPKQPESESNMFENSDDIRDSHVESEEQLDTKGHFKTTKSTARNGLKSDNKTKVKDKTSSEVKTKALIQKRLNQLSDSDLIASKEILESIKKSQIQTPEYARQDRFFNDEIERRKKELELKSKQLRSVRQKQDIIEAREQTLRKANSLKRMKSESMRELNLRNLIRTEEKSMELKLRDKKFSFIRRVNDTLAKLERERSIQQHKTKRSNIDQELKQLKHQMESIQTYYKTQGELVREQQQQARHSRSLVERAYKQEVFQLTRELRQQHTKKLGMLRMRSQHQLLNLEEEENVEQEVRELYKKYR